MSAGADEPAGNLERRDCPICRRPTQTRYRPFCSKRCADIDLGRWFGETYRIPAESGADETDTPDANQDDEERR